MLLSDGVPSAQQHASTHHLTADLTGIVFELLNTGEVSDRSLNQLVSRWPVLSVHNQMRGTREDRVRLLNRALDELSMVEQESLEIRGFLAGFLTTYIGPGTLDYIPLLRPYLDRIPGAAELVWITVGTSRIAVGAILRCRAR